MDIRIWAIVAGAVGLGFVGFLMRTILRESEGTEKMREILYDLLELIKSDRIFFLFFAELGIYTPPAFKITSDGRLKINVNRGGELCCLSHQVSKV